MENKSAIPIKKSWKRKAKSAIALVLVVALIFAYIPPAYAREGNTGKSSTFTAMLLGAVNGAMASANFSVTGIAVQIAVGLVDLMYYYNDYSNYNRAVFSINIGGTHINITRSQLVSMVASIAASTVAGAANGQSGSSLLNSAVETVAETMVTTVITQILIKKCGWDPYLAQIVSALVGRAMSSFWPREKQSGDKSSSDKEVSQEEKDRIQKIMKEDNGQVTKKQVQDGMRVVNNQIAEKKKELANLESSHGSAAMINKLRSEIIGLESFLGNLNSVNKSMEASGARLFTPVQLSKNCVELGVSGRLKVMFSGGGKETLDSKAKKGLENALSGMAEGIAGIFPRYREGEKEAEPTNVNVPDSGLTVELKGGKIIPLSEFRAIQAGQQAKLNEAFREAEYMAAQAGLSKPTTIKEVQHILGGYVHLTNGKVITKEQFETDRANYIKSRQEMATKVPGYGDITTVEGAIKFDEKYTKVITTDPKTGQVIQEKIMTLDEWQKVKLEQDNRLKAQPQLQPGSPPAPVSPGSPTSLLQPGQGAVMQVIRTENVNILNNFSGTGLETLQPATAPSSTPPNPSP